MNQFVTIVQTMFFNSFRYEMDTVVEGILQRKNNYHMTEN